MVGKPHICVSLQEGANRSRLQKLLEIEQSNGAFFFFGPSFRMGQGDADQQWDRKVHSEMLASYVDKRYIQLPSGYD